MVYFYWTLLFQNVLLIGAELRIQQEVVFVALFVNGFVLSHSSEKKRNNCYTVAFLRSYSFLPPDRHLGFVIIVSTPRCLLTIDLHFTVISHCSHTVTLCAFLFFLFPAIGLNIQLTLNYF